MTKYKTPKELNPFNDPLKANVIKLLISVDSDTSSTIHKSYIIRKLQSILAGTVTWHKSVENAYETGYQYAQPDMFS